jgi:hypothetical protein
MTYKIRYTVLYRALDEGELPALRSSRFIPAEIPSSNRLGGTQNQLRSVGEKVCPYLESKQDFPNLILDIPWCYTYYKVLITCHHHNCDYPAVETCSHVTRLIKHNRFLC